jgi:hypothetical protein
MYSSKKNLEKHHFSWSLMKRRCWIVNDGAMGAKNHQNENVYDVKMNYSERFFFLSVQPFNYLCRKRKEEK